MIIKEEINAALGKGLTQAQLDALHNARVAVVGLGGLGSNISVALTRLGIGQLYLYDFDKVELSNLNRQYYFLDNIGQYKADALVKHLRRINPYATLHSQVVKVTQENIPALLGDCDIICESSFFICITPFLSKIIIPFFAQNQNIFYRCGSKNPQYFYRDSTNFGFFGIFLRFSIYKRFSCCYHRDNKTVRSSL